MQPLGTRTPTVSVRCSGGLEAAFRCTTSNDSHGLIGSGMVSKQRLNSKIWESMKIINKGFGMGWFFLFIVCLFVLQLRQGIYVLKRFSLGFVADRYAYKNVTF